MLKDRSIICFAGEDWWYHHPHSKNHIMKRLARENRVMFVNSISMGLPSVRSADFFAKIRRKLKSYAKFVRRTPDGIVVVFVAETSEQGAEREPRAQQEPQAPQESQPQQEQTQIFLFLAATPLSLALSLAFSFSFSLLVKRAKEREEEKAQQQRQQQQKQ